MDALRDELSDRLRNLATGDDLNMILPPSGFSDPTAEQPVEDTPLDTVEEQRLGLVEQPQPSSRERFKVSQRFVVQRDGVLPAPSQAPPAPPPLTDPPPQPPDSLSLMQLRNLVKEMPRVDPTPYAFAYKDAATLPEEIEEWFSYTTPERANILRAQSCFSTEWALLNDSLQILDEGSPLDWTKTAEEVRRSFMEKTLHGLAEVKLEKKLDQLEALVYLVLGCWHETAGLEGSKADVDHPPAPLQEVKDQELRTVAPDHQDVECDISRSRVLAEQYGKSGAQIEWLRYNTKMLFGVKGGLQTVYDIMRTASMRECGPESVRAEYNAGRLEFERRELWCALTILYVCLEVVRSEADETEQLALRSQILSLSPSLLVFMGEIINKIRWDQSITGELQQSSDRGPSPKLLLLMWKSVLVCLGGLSEVEKAKAAFREQEQNELKESKGPIITASPLDYHTFRQEISSKYPAYEPPPSYFPIEPDQRSLLPPLRINQSKPQASSFPTEPAQHGTSIINQPIHIATPAPSPPPSPAMGKAGKKQNYQTPHGMPFNYPPLDASSSDIGGKGSTALQDALVGRKWQGSDIPTSILEAAELFSKRMRATRALKQLWEERVEFMKYERGWTGADDDEELGSTENGADGESSGSVRPDRYDGSTEERLETVERFYREGLANLQSIVMVLMKTILSNVTSLITQAAGTSSMQSGFHFQENGMGVAEGRTNGGLLIDLQADVAKLGQDELDRMRGEEIAAKAVTGLLLLLLKWFKVSHVLKFEYLTQLLVDANYIPMVLKLLQTQEIERVVNYRCESEDWNFFRYCRAHSRVGLQVDSPSSPPSARTDDPPSEDDAIPPPILRHRRTSPPEMQMTAVPGAVPSNFPPEVDELGNPTTQLPLEPITNFSWRNFFTNINYLRILQKACKNKAHRNLMLITYKSANHLKKSLKVPQPLLRLYTLKLFKSQVPFCGRKWRQGNMRVITAVYLHVRPDLRDDWLSGSDVDGDVDQAVPMEQSLRALTHWYNLRRYPVQMGARRGVLKEEQDFFARELERMDWGGEMLAEEYADGAAVVDGNEWGVGQLEGW